MNFLPPILFVFMKKGKEWVVIESRYCFKKEIEEGRLQKAHRQRQERKNYEKKSNIQYNSLVDYQISKKRRTAIEIPMPDVNTVLSI